MLKRNRIKKDQINAAEHADASDNAGYSRYRALLIGFLILDLIAFSLLAASYFWGGNKGEQIIKYEDAELVFDDLSEQKVIPSGEPVGIYLKTDGVMVVDSGTVENLQGEQCSPCKGHFTDRRLYYEDKRKRNRNKKRTDGSVVGCRKRSSPAYVCAG